MILDRIVQTKRAEHQKRPPAQLASLVARASALAPARPLAQALRGEARHPLRVIAEFKRRSPSAGAIRPGADPAEVAADYARAGAAAVSVLTDGEFFDGAPEHLGRARAACDLALLRKDFLLDERDVVESRLLGADAVLLIVRLLERALLRALLEVARSVGLESLVESHGERETDVALGAGAGLIGINHRDLDTLAVDLDLSRRARAQVGPAVTLVAESGIHSAADLARMAEHGVDAVLVGETLMRAASPGAALADLLRDCRSLRGQRCS